MKLYRVTVTTSEVSGVVTAQTRYGPYTEFNFTADGRRQYAVQMRGTVRRMPRAEFANHATASFVTRLARINAPDTGIS